MTDRTVKLHEEAPGRLAPGKLGRRPRVFCASMADVFEPGDIRIEGARLRLFSLILATPQLDWLVLTKRPEVAREWMPEVESFTLVEEWPLPNVWLGVSIENSRYTWRADVLREIPAAVRFISAEPLLGSLANENKTLNRAPLDLAGIDWVIVGGESGPKARPFNLTHAREILEAVDERWIVHGHDVALFVKQLGAKPIDASGVPLELRDRKGGDPEEWPVDLRIREHPRSDA